MPRYAFLFTALAATAAAQAVSNPDPTTGITFATFKDPNTGAQFGVVAPQSFTGDFIGQLVAPAGSNGTGYIGLSLGPSMLNNLLVAAWVTDGGEVVSSFRRATGYTPPAPFPASNISAIPVTTGTFVNSTHYAYTFLCKGCLTSQPNWQGDVTGTGLGWALSTNAPSGAAGANASLPFHNAGQGIFTLSFTEAQSADFAAYAAMAESGGGGSPEPAPPADPGTGNGGGGGGAAPAPTVSRPGGSRPTSRSRRPTRPAPTGVLPVTTLLPTGGGGGGGSRPRPTRRPRPGRPGKTQRSRPIVAPTPPAAVAEVAAASAAAPSEPFRPVLEPESAVADDYEGAQRFKASFLDGWYKEAE